MAMIDLLGRLLDRIMNKDNAHTFSRATDSLEAISEAIALIIVIVEQIGRPEVQLYEGWQDELGIDFTLWTVVNPTTPWSRGAGAGVAAPFLRATAPLLLNEVARLVGNQRWQLAPDTWNTNTVLRRTIIEFEMTIANLANLDNTQCVFGFTPNQADVRGSQNIIALALVGAANALQTVTDLVGVETVNTGFGENLANYNKFCIDIQHDGVVRFYLNEVLIATHITNLPDLPMYPNFYFDTTAGGGATPQIGVVRIWTEDYERP